MNSEETRPQITVEDLLRLKRAERPGPEFWAQFEQELRAKQLAAIVEKKPWWCGLPRVYVFALRHRLYLGSAGAAMLAAGVGLRVYTAPSASRPAPAMAYATRSSEAVAAAPQPAAAPASAPVAAQALPAPASEPMRVARAASRPASAPADPSLPLITMSEAPPAAPAYRFETLSRSMTVGLAAAQAAASQLARSLPGEDSAFDTRLVPASAPVAEPLAQMSSPAEERRSRLRDAEAFSAMAGSGNLVLPAGERRVSRLDDRADSDISRYNLTTGRDEIGVSIRF
ncbi:MAG TPA: hypothetical protein VHC86_12615 [Opitutaceae bacterium]|nr:hypothetical protein [Opitutaceae bacterium]